MITQTCKYEDCGKTFNPKRRARKYCSLLCANRKIAGRQAEEIMSKKSVKLLSYGGGVDSTVIAILIINGTIERPEHIVMVDTGYEKQSTWDYINKVVQPRLTEVGLEIKILKTNDYSDNSIIDKNGMVRIPACRKNLDGSVSKLRTCCNGGWKATVVNRWMRKIGIERVEQWIGFSADESRRKLKNKKKWISFRYPLIELGMTRNDCIYYAGKHNWPMPPRTSCYFCPQQRDEQWRQMARDEPEEFQRAVDLEIELHKTKPDIFLHRSCKDLKEWMKVGA